MSSRGEPATGAERVQRHAERRRAAGQVQVTVREWVAARDEQRVRDAMRRAADAYRQPVPD